MSGIYISAFATSETKDRLTSLLAQASHDLPALSPDEIHVTLAHDNECETPPQDLMTFADSLRTYSAHVLCVEQWETGNGNPILVASLYAPELHERWQYWTEHGLHWGFPSFRPHFSLTDGIKGVPRKTVAKWCRILNEALQGANPFTFSSEYVQTVRADAFRDPKSNDDERPVEESRARGSSGKASGKSRPSSIPMDGIPTHRPQLSKEEERSMRHHGFNAHGIMDRVHDQRQEDSDE